MSSTCDGVSHAVTPEFTNAHAMDRFGRRAAAIYSRVPIFFGVWPSARVMNHRNI